MDSRLAGTGSASRQIKGNDALRRGDAALAVARPDSVKVIFGTSTAMESADGGVDGRVDGVALLPALFFQELFLFGELARFHVVVHAFGGGNSLFSEAVDGGGNTAEVTIYSLEKLFFCDTCGVFFFVALAAFGYQFFGELMADSARLEVEKASDLALFFGEIASCVGECLGAFAFYFVEAVRHTGNG